MLSTFCFRKNHPLRPVNIFLLTFIKLQNVYLFLNQNSILARNHPKSEIIIPRNVLVFLFLSLLMSVYISDKFVQPVERVEDWVLLSSGRSEDWVVLSSGRREDLVLMSSGWSEDWVLLSVGRSNSNRCRKKLQKKSCAEQSHTRDFHNFPIWVLVFTNT